MQKIKGFLNNTLTVLLLLVLGLGVTLFVSNQVRQPVTQQKSKITVMPITPTDTPEPTRIPTVIPVIITVLPTPTPAPSLTPTPTFEPLSDKPIGGYIFSPPEFISSRSYIEIVGWLTGSNEELIVNNFENDAYLVEIFNIKSGQRQHVVQTSDNIVGRPVWLPDTQQIAYLAQDKTGIINLYLSALSKQEGDTLNLEDISPPLAPAFDGKSVLVFDKEMRQLQKSNRDTKRALELSITEPLPNMNGGPFARYQAAWSNSTNWVAYYNPKKFMLINPKISEIREMNLGKISRNLEDFWVLYAVWSLSGEKLAMVVTSDSPDQNITFTQLAIFDLTTGNMQLIDDNFIYVTNVAWAPDNHQVLISAVIRQLDGYNVEALFLVNTETKQIDPVPIMPQDALGFSSFSSLAWSPDGKQIIVGYAVQPGQSGWYRVAVKTP